MTIYKESDLEWLRAVSAQAQEKWDDLAHKYMLSNPKPGLECWGSCVCGEGFVVQLISKGKRKPREVFIVRAWGAACRGSNPWEVHKDTIQKFFEDKGVDVEFVCGRMD